MNRILRATAAASIVTFSSATCATASAPSLDAALPGSSAATSVATTSSAAASPAVAAPATRAQQTPKPTLVVFITIDQMRGDYLQRFSSQFTGGLHRFAVAGAQFTQAYHDHAITETAPGHATTMSGRFPVHTGITSNSYGVEDPRSPVIGSSSTGASPQRFIGTTLLDWMRANDRNTRFLSVSRKDRGAILPIGKSKGDVYWYSPEGNFTTSKYYATSLPRWVNDFNAQRYPTKYRGWTWNLVLPPSAYPEPDSVPAESQGQEFMFPHTVIEDDALAAASLGNFPVMDELTLRFAMRGLQQLQLGANPNRTDLLNISLSTTDAIGHRYGPDSRELHDQLLQLDRFLGAFVDSLFQVRDSTRVILTLTGDHGMSPFPTVRSPITPNPNAQYVDVYPVWRKAIVRLQALGIDTNQVDYSQGMFLVGDTTSFARNKVRIDSVARALDTAFMQVPGVYRADYLPDLTRADTVKDFVARRWLHMFAPGGLVRSVVTLDEFNYYDGIHIATHGSPWNSDAWVPMVFWGTPFATGKFSEPVRVVDMAPTIAAALHIKPLEKIDGVPLSDALRK